MIYKLSGIISSVHSDFIVINIGNIELCCKTPYNNNFVIMQKISLFTSFLWNADQGPSLAGFLTHEEKRLFELLTTCSGIGPRAGLAILTTLGYNGTVVALLNQNAKMLAQTPGIGMKKAELVIIELKNKIKEFTIQSDNKQNDKFNEVIDVLKQLGYSQKDLSFFNTFLLQNSELLTRPTSDIIHAALTQSQALNS